MKYGNGFQLAKSDEYKIYETAKCCHKKEKVMKLNKKDQKIIDMKGQKSIYDAWS